MTNLPSAHYVKRKRAAARFRLYGLAAVGFSCLILLVLLGNILMQGASGFLETQIQLTQGENLREALLRMPGVTVENNAPKTEENVRMARKLFSIDATRQMKETRWVSAASAVDLWAKEKVTQAELFAAGRLSAAQVELLTHWQDLGRVKRVFDSGFFTYGDSREPELAGFAASIIGSLLTVAACLLVAFPVGVLAAAYLEEFAPKSRLSDIIEVNINNLAAVPSIVFGLLGLSLYLNLFGLPRSSSLVGGLTLAMMVLPVIIISTRAALRAVPSSLRDAARALGATELQVLLHHTLPLSLPGIMTGTILAVARALGETAPLLMIGMVAFMADVPTGFTDSATVMPVQVYLWASSPEAGFAEKTATGILVLILILLAMNLLAIWLRNKYEKKW